MYVPEQFRITDDAVINEFITAHNFATIITADADSTPIASHLPLILHAKEAHERTLHGHVARANTHWKLFEQGRTTLVVFQGAHSYVSPRWYNHENVPTWNYLTVHAYCTPRIFTQREELLVNVEQLTEKYELPEEYSIHALSPRFLEKELRGIVGFELAVERVEAAFKLSQNRDTESHASIMTHLEASQNMNEQGIAAAMKLHSPHR